MKNTKEAAWLSFIYIPVAIVMIFVLGALFTEKENISVNVFSLLAACFFCFVVFIFSRHLKVSKKQFIVIWAVVQGSMAIVLFSLINPLRFIPVYDLGHIFYGAYEWVTTGTFIEYSEYFYYFPNNLGGMTFLYCFFRLFDMFTKDYFLLAAILNGFCVLCSLFFITFAAYKKGGITAGILSLLAEMLFLPFYFMADSFYTDTLSMPFVIILIVVYLYMAETESTAVRTVLSVIFSVVAFIGSYIKMTVFIVVIACLIALLIKKKYSAFLICFCTVAIAMTGLNKLTDMYMYSRFLSKDIAYTQNTPILHWVMMGLNDKGAYSNDDYTFTRSIGDIAGRNKILWEEIKRRISARGFSGMWTLMAEKMRVCFGEGTLGLSDFLDDSPVNTLKIQDYIFYSGSKYQYYRNYCNVIFRSFLLLGFGNLIILFRDKKASPLPIAYAGIALFLMIWESSYRYVTNFLPLIILSAAGIVRLYDKSYEK